MLLITCFLCNNYSFAQEKKPNVSVLFGPNLVTLHGGNPLDGLTSNVRGALGISFQYPLKRKVAIRSYLLYEKKGCILPDRILLDSTLTTILDVGKIVSNFDYLTIPVLLEYTTGRRVKYSFAAGGYFAYLVKHKNILYGLNNPPLVLYEGFILANREDFGLSGSANVSVPISKRLSVNANILYNRGVRNFFKKEFSEIFEYYNSSANLLFGLTYEINDRNYSLSII